MASIRVNRGEPIDRALRRLKRKVDREGIIKEARNRRAYEKPSRAKYRKMRRAKFNTRIQSKLEQDWINYS